MEIVKKSENNNNNSNENDIKNMKTFYLIDGFCVYNENMTTFYFMVVPLDTFNH